MDQPPAAANDTATGTMDQQPAAPVTTMDKPPADPTAGTAMDSTPATTSSTPGGATRRKTPLAERPCPKSNQMRLASGRCGVRRGPTGTPVKRSTPLSQRSVTRRRAPHAGDAMLRVVEQLTSDVRHLETQMASVDKSFQTLYDDMEREMKALEQRILGSKKRKSMSSSSSSKYDDDSSSDDGGVGHFVKQYNAAIAAKNAANKKY